MNIEAGSRNTRDICKICLLDFTDWDFFSKAHVVHNIKATFYFWHDDAHLVQHWDVLKRSWSKSQYLHPSRICFCSLLSCLQCGWVTEWIRFLVAAIYSTTMGLAKQPSWAFTSSWTPPRMDKEQNSPIQLYVACISGAFPWKSYKTGSGRHRIVIIGI